MENEKDGAFADILLFEESEILSDLFVRNGGVWTLPFSLKREFIAKFASVTQGLLSSP